MCAMEAEVEFCTKIPNVLKRMASPRLIRFFFVSLLFVCLSRAQGTGVEWHRFAKKAGRGPKWHGHVATQKAIHGACPQTMQRAGIPQTKGHHAWWISREQGGSTYQWHNEVTKTSMKGRESAERYPQRTRIQGVMGLPIKDLVLAGC